MIVAHVNKLDHRLYLELQGFSMKYLFLGIYHGKAGQQADKTYQYSFLDMEGSNEGARATEVIHD
jgi:hypothetical protein